MTSNNNKYFRNNINFENGNENDARHWGGAWLQKKGPFLESRDNVIKVVKALLPRLQRHEFDVISLEANTASGMKWIELEAFPDGMIKIIILRPREDVLSFGSTPRTPTETLRFLKNFIKNGWWGGMWIADVRVGRKEGEKFVEYETRITGRNKPVAGRSRGGGGGNSLHTSVLRSMYFSKAPKNAFIASRNPRTGFTPYDRKTMRTVSGFVHPLQEIPLRVARTKPQPRRYTTYDHILNGTMGHMRPKLMVPENLSLPSRWGKTTHVQPSGVSKAARRKMMMRRRK